MRAFSVPPVEPFYTKGSKTSGLVRFSWCFFFFALFSLVLHVVLLCCCFVLFVCVFKEGLEIHETYLHLAKRFYLTNHPMMKMM